MSAFYCIVIFRVVAVLISFGIVIVKTPSSSFAVIASSLASASLIRGRSCRLFVYLVAFPAFPFAFFELNCVFL